MYIYFMPYMNLAEVQEYAIWLGMDLEEDKELIWIAEEGLKAPCPEHWKACKTLKGDVYYFNFANGESIWDHPLDEHYRKLFLQEREKQRCTRKRRREEAAGQLQQSKKAEVANGPGLGAGEISQNA
eukprot:548947-Pelagomonas_calceolata.AAC.2